MNGLNIVAICVVMLGLFLKLKHYPNVNLILYIGFMASFVISGIEISRLKKIIKGLEKEIPKTK